MTKRITNIYQPIQIGDYILNEITGIKYFAEICPECDGRGVIHGNIVIAQCFVCHSMKFVFAPESEIAMQKTLTPAKPDVES